MKIIQVILVVLLILMKNSEARIGETREQCEQRYGKSLGSKDSYVIYHKNDYDIVVHFYNDYADQIVYDKPNHEPFSDREVKTLLEINSYEREWKYIGNNSWTTAGRELHAGRSKTTLAIWTAEYAKREDKKKEGEDNKKLDGL